VARQADFANRSSAQIVNLFRTPTQTIRGHLKHRLAIALASIIVVLFGQVSPVLASTLCNDGWVSSSSGSGTCSWHGGIAYTYSVPKIVTKQYGSCAKLRRDYPFGVTKAFPRIPNYYFYVPTLAPSVYKANIRLDGDRNGLACEVRLPWTFSVTTPSAPTPSPSPTTPVLGTLAYPGHLGESVSIDGYDILLASNLRDSSDTICSRIPNGFPLEGCLYEKNAFGTALQALGKDPASSKEWLEVQLQITKTSKAAYSYPLTGIAFSLYPSDSSSITFWSSGTEPTFSGDYRTPWLDPFTLGEKRTLTLHFLTPKLYRGMKIAFQMSPYGSAADRRFFYPLTY